jgi:hypothetical protein
LLPIIESIAADTSSLLTSSLTPGSAILALAPSSLYLLPLLKNFPWYSPPFPLNNIYAAEEEVFGSLAIRHLFKYNNNI